MACVCCGASTGKASDEGLCPNCDGYVELAVEKALAHVRAAVKDAITRYEDHLCCGVGADILKAMDGEPKRWGN